ncbi:hypothetical protein [Variovorax sp. Sphag1AA]|uniref:hypothetical protein n=1 Tax=Variovorax sp. Sphag1AA TaxID=2587027 RepID=UPI00161CC665|nr:hypothetical protein [Variovorax sp. Sphag1AA]MBB3181011.1 hypothetical protein [Variovorax sp. Sphag1AA]
MQNDHDTSMGWWTDKPERHDRSTFFAPLGGLKRESEERVWMKVVAVATIMVAFGISILRIAAQCV